MKEEVPVVSSNVPRGFGTLPMTDSTPSTYLHQRAPSGIP